MEPEELGAEIEELFEFGVQRANEEYVWHGGMWLGDEVQIFVCQGASEAMKIDSSFR
jgi:hypothetical protein